jgi:excisionase family DNA binding protein
MSKQGSTVANQQPDTLDYRDPEWVADRLGLDKNTVYKYLQDGTLPGLQLGRKWLISERLLASFLDDAARKQTDQRSARTGGWRKRIHAIDRMTPRTNAALDAARDAAMDMGHSYIGTEHILAGIVAVPDSLGAQALADAGAGREAVEDAVRAAIAPGDAGPGDKITITPRVDQLMRAAAREAKSLGHRYIGTEHIVLAMLDLGEGIGSGVLRTLGVTPDAARAAITRRLAEPRG